MRRRGVGIGAVRKKQEQAKQFSEVGEQLTEANLAHVSAQLELFRANLQQFAVQHKSSIKKDPDFRRKFQVMCAKIGVDPLASKKGFWSELLDVGDFYYELAVQIIEVCILTRPKNGGLIGMSDLLRLLAKKRGPAMQQVSDDDVKRAVQKLNVLGEGFRLIDMEARTMVRTE
jgi:ESCRT-II complex subunit VPS22